MATQDKQGIQENERQKFMNYFKGLPREQLPAGLNVPSIGSSHPVVTFEVFSDFQCPHCKRGADRMKEVFAKWGDKMQMFYHSYPLDSSCNKTLTHQIHENACHAAVAAQCAFRQGKFWEYHDLLFANQDSLKDDDLLRYAQQAGLKTDDFQACTHNPEALSLVEDDISLADRLKIESTPTYFINGRRIVGSLPLEFYGDILALESGEPGAPPAASTHP